MGRRAIEVSDLDRVLASLLEKARIEDGQSYERLAAKCDMGRTRLYDVLTGARPLVMSELDRICDALGLVPWRVMREAEETVRAAPPALPADVDAYALAAQHESGVSEDDVNV